ncbi:MAG: SGNH/GDSL hydrolase family protein [Fuerstiella sp.]
MAENFILLLFTILPPVLFIFTGRFIRQSRPTWKQHKLRSLLVGNLMVLLTLLSVAMLGGEVYYRFFYDSTDSFGLTRTTKRWFERHFQRNKTGFRDSLNYMPTAPPDKRRITFVGDSFTAGHGIKDVEQRFANRVRAANRDCEIHVLAECGWDTGKELELINYIPTSGYELDVVVLVYCLNDISDITPEWQDILDRLYKVPDRGFFNTHSYLFNTIHARLRMAREPEVRNYYSFVKDAYAGRAWERQQKRLTSFQKFVTDAGGELLVVTFPFLHDIGPDYEYGEIHAQLAEFWQQKGVSHLDLLDAFSGVSADDVVISVHDAHPNERGHAMAAEAISAFLTDHVQKDRPVDNPMTNGPLRNDPGRP